MKCPQCGSRELKIDVTFTGWVSCTFDEDGDFEVDDSESHDSEWDSKSGVHCYNCQHDCTVKEAEAAVPKKKARGTAKRSLTGQ